MNSLHHPARGGGDRERFPPPTLDDLDFALLCGPEWAAWYRLTPAERWQESERLWDTFRDLGGTLGVEPDTHDPGFDADAWRALPAHGRAGVRALRRRGFSRDTDLTVLADAENLRRLTTALDDLVASVIAVPPFEARYLERGHAVYFACAAAGGMRVDVMARMRNVPPFAECWERRSTYALPEAGEVEVLGLEDLVRCKKTRRDKDWSMVRRLVEANYAEATAADAALDVTPERVAFWLREMRSPALLREVAARSAAAPEPYAGLLRDAAAERPAVALAARGAADADIADALVDEERREREADDAYWRPLIRELEALRHAVRRRT